MRHSAGRTISVTGATEKLMLRTHYRIVGLELFDMAVYGRVGEAPRGGERAGGSPIRGGNG